MGTHKGPGDTRGPWGHALACDHASCFPGTGALRGDEGGRSCPTGRRGRACPHSDTAAEASARDAGHSWAPSSDARGPCCHKAGERRRLRGGHMCRNGPVSPEHTACPVHVQSATRQHLLSCETQRDVRRRAAMHAPRVSPTHRVSSRGGFPPAVGPARQSPQQPHDTWPFRHAFALVSLPHPPR